MIRLTKLTDYAFVLLGFMARETDGSAYAAPDLAKATGVAAPMVSKILKALGRGGVVESTRGAKGGYRLGRAPELITAADIIVALEGPIALTDCSDPLDLGCRLEMLCPARTAWGRITQVLRRELESLTLADMAAPCACGGHKAVPAASGRESGPMAGDVAEQDYGAEHEHENEQEHEREFAASRPLEPAGV